MSSQLVPEKPSSDLYWLPFMKRYLPNTLRLIVDGDKSYFFQMVQRTFDLLHDLQFRCLPSTYRAVGMQHFLSLQKEKNREKMEASYKQWLEKESLYLSDKGYDVPQFSREEKAVVKCTRKVLFRLIHEEQKFLREQDPFFPFFSIWDSTGKQNLDYEAKWTSLRGENNPSFLEEKWKSYSQKECVYFQQMSGCALESLSKELQELAKVVRNIFFKIIYEEQECHGAPLPFVSICNHEGDLNYDYWIDLLDAETKRNGEKLPEKTYLKECCDFDIMRTLYAPHEGDELVCKTGMRQNNAQTPDFCNAVLSSMVQFSNCIKSRSTFSSKSKSEQLKTILNVVTSQGEKVLYFQNHFCDALTSLYYLHGDSVSLFKLLDIKRSNLNETAESEILSAMEKECETILNHLESLSSLPALEEEDLKNLVLNKIKGYQDIINTLNETFEDLGILLNHFYLSDFLNQKIPSCLIKRKNPALDFTLSSSKQIFEEISSALNQSEEVSHLKKNRVMIKSHSSPSTSEIPDVNLQPSIDSCLRMHQVFKKIASIIKREVDLLET